MVAAVIIQMHDLFPPEHNDLAVKREDGICRHDPVGHGKGNFVGKVFIPLHHKSLKFPLFVLYTEF